MTTCVVCNQTIADRSTYIPTSKGPMHPRCWDQDGGKTPTEQPNKMAEIARLRNESIDERIRIMADDIREMDQLIWAMSQCVSWGAMQPIFTQLLDLTIKRKRAESDRINDILRRELLSVYTPDQLKLLDRK